MVPPATTLPPVSGSKPFGPGAHAQPSGERRTDLLAGGLGGGGGREKPRSLLQQALDLPVQFGVGLAHGAKVGVMQGIAVPHLLYDAARGDLPESGWKGYVERYAPVGPFGLEMGQSFARTGQRIANPGRGLAEYRQASEEGRVLDLATEDIGNVAAASTLGARALGATRGAVIEASASEAPYFRGGRVPQSVGAQALAQPVPTAAGAAAVGESVLPRLVPPVADAPMPVPYPRASLARHFQNVGRPTAAARTAQAGNVLRTVGHLGDTATGPAFLFTGPLKGAGWAMRRAGLGEYVPKTMVLNAVERAGAEGSDTRRGRALWRFSEEGRRFARSEAEMNRGVVEADRLAMVPERIASEAKLPDAHQAAVSAAVAQDWNPVADTIESVMQRDRGGLTDAQIDDLIERTWVKGELEEGMRPTPEAIRTFIAYRQAKNTGDLGGLDPEQFAAMQAMEQAQRNLSQFRTDAIVDQDQWTKDPVTGEYTRTEAQRGTVNTAPLNPEQLDQTLRPSIVGREQRLVERTRDSLTPTWETKETRAQAAWKIARAYADINEQLPEIPVARNERRAQRFNDRQQDMIRRHRKNQDVLANAVDEYTRLVEADAPPAMLAESMSKLDAAIAQGELLRDQLERRKRIADSTAALSRASGEVEAGPRRVMDAEGNVVNVSDDLRQPEVAVEGQPTGRQVREHAAELRGRMVDEAEAVIAREFSEQRLLLDDELREHLDPGEAGKNRLSGFSKADQVRLRTEGWISEGPGRGQSDGVLRMNVDEFTDMVNQTLGTDWSMQQVVDHYLRRIRELWEIRDKKRKGKAFASAHLIERTAEELGLPVEQVATALRGKIADYTGMLRTGPEQLMGELRQAFLDLPENLQGIWADYASEVDSTYTALQVAEDIAKFFPEFDVRELSQQLIEMGSVDMRHLVEWMAKGDVTTSLRSVLGERGAKEYTQIGRRLGEVAGARELLAENRRQFNVAVSDVNRALRQGERAEAQAARHIADSQAKVDSSSPVEGPVRPADYRRDEYSRSQAETWRQRQTRSGTWSIGERARYDAGVMSERARQLQVDANRVRRAIDKANEKIADMPAELARSFQDRMIEDVNRRAVNGMHRALSTGIAKLGGIVGRNEGASLTGQVARFARKYGFYDELLDELKTRREELRDALKREADHDEYESDAEWGSVTPLDPVLSANDVAASFEAVMDRNGIRMENWEHSQWDDSVQSEVLRERMAHVMAEQTEGLALNAPFRVNEVVRDSDWNMPQEVRNRYDKSWQSYQDRRGAMLNRGMDRYAEAIPAPYRAAHYNAKRHVAALVETAEQLNASRPGDGDIYLDMAFDTATSLDHFVARGYDPVHLIGGAESLSTGGARRTGFGGYKQRRMRHQAVRRTGLRELNAGAYARVEADQFRKLLLNQRDKWVTDQFGRRADQVPALRREINGRGGAMIPPREMKKLAEDNGWHVLGGADGVGRDTILLPKHIVDALDQPGWYQHPLYRGLRRFNQMWKSWVLPFSAKWLSGNAIGNVLMAWTYGGVGPVKLASYMNKIRKAEGGIGVLWEQSGVARGLPPELTTNGLTANEYRVRWNGDVKEPRYFIGRMLNRSYKLNEFVDNLARSSVYLAKLGEGIPRETAMATTLQAMGDFQRLSPFERRVVREVLPFYAWMRHSFQATLRFPIHHPGRAAFAYHLANLFTDPEEREWLELMGSRLPFGGGQFVDVGSFSPGADINESRYGPFDPRSLGRAVTPAGKLVASLGFGVDLNTMDRITRPGDSANRGIYGQVEATPSWSRLGVDPRHALGEIGWQVINQAAPASIKSIRDLALPHLGLGATDAPRFAGTGYESARGEPDPNKNTRDLILRSLNLPSGYQLDIDRLEEEAAKRRRREQG